MARITVESVVTAPIELVWDIYNNPEDIQQWNTASSDWHTVNSKNDLRVGGQFSNRMEAKDGSMGFDFAGTYTEIIPHKKLPILLVSEMLKFTLHRKMMLLL